MIWIYSCQGPLSRSVISFLSDKLNPTSLHLVSDLSNSPDYSSAPEGITWLQQHADEVEFCLFLGLEKATWTPNQADQLPSYFKQVWRQCVQHDIPFLYFSTYETYGGQETPWNDNELTLQELTPISSFGKACHTLDQWVIQQSKKPYYWAGLKLAEIYHDQPLFFNLASPSTAPTNEMPYIPLLSEGDAIDIVWYFMRSRKISGLFNITSSEYWVGQSDMNHPDIRRMDRHCSMNYQKLRNAYPQMTLKSMTITGKDRVNPSVMTS